MGGARSRSRWPERSRSGACCPGLTRHPADEHRPSSRSPARCPRRRPHRAVALGLRAPCALAVIESYTSDSIRGVGRTSYSFPINGRGRRHRRRIAFYDVEIPIGIFARRCSSSRPRKATRSSRTRLSSLRGSEARDVLASFPALLQHVVPVILEPVGRDDLLGRVLARDGSDCPCATPVDARSLRRPIHYGHTS